MVHILSCCGLQNDREGRVIDENRGNNLKKKTNFWTVAISISASMILLYKRN